jgi:hypothetical protein
MASKIMRRVFRYCGAVFGGNRRMVELTKDSEYPDLKNFQVVWDSIASFHSRARRAARD